MPDGQQMHLLPRRGHGVQDQVLATQVLRRDRPHRPAARSQLAQRFGRLRWLVEIAPADAREAPQVRMTVLRSSSSSVS